MARTLFESEDDRLLRAKRVYELTVRQSERLEFYKRKCEVVDDSYGLLQKTFFHMQYSRSLLHSTPGFVSVSCMCGWCLCGCVLMAKKVAPFNNTSLILGGKTLRVDYELRV